MRRNEFEEAMQSYRRYAKKKIETHSLQPNSDSRLMKAISNSAQQFVHDTGEIRLQDIDQLGPHRVKKLAEIGIWTPDDLYDEYERGNYEGLLALQKGDNSLTPKILASAISASPELPPASIPSGAVTAYLPDGTPIEFSKETIFDMFKREMYEENLNNEQKKASRLLTADQKMELLKEFKSSNSVYGIQKTLEDVKDALGDPEPFSYRDSGGKLKGRRPTEMKKYLSKFGINGEGNQLITLEERGAFLTNDIISAFDVIPRGDVEIINSSLREITPAGKKKAIKGKILELVKHDLGTGTKNTIKGLLSRKGLSNLEDDPDEIAGIVEEMIEDDETLKPVDDINSDKLFPTNKEIINEITKSHSVKIGKTTNPRIADYFDTIIKYPDESYSEFMDRLMQMGGKAVMENTGISRRRLNLKVPIADEDDLDKAIEILGYNIKHGFAPEGYEYKDPRYAERYNTFNVWVRPPKDLINRYNVADGFVENDQDFVFLLDKPTKYIPNHEMTNLIARRSEYVTSLCPVSKSEKKIKEQHALASALAGAYDTEKPNRRGITDVVEKEDGIMTAMCKLGKAIKPNEFKGTDCYAWNQENLAKKVENVLESDEFENYENKKHTKKFKSLAEETTPILEEMKKAESKSDEIESDARGKIGKYYKRRRVGCTQVEDIDLKPENKILVTVPKNSQAGKDLKKKIDEVCPAEHTSSMDRCVRNNIQLHQNLTEGDQLTKGIRYQNLSFLGSDVLNDGLKIIRNKVFGSPDDWIGGRKKQKMVFDQLEMGKYKTLDLGVWKFLD